MLITIHLLLKDNEKRGAESVLSTTRLHPDIALKIHT